MHLELRHYGKIDNLRLEGAAPSLSTLYKSVYSVLTMLLRGQIHIFVQLQWAMVYSMPYNGVAP